MKRELYDKLHRLWSKYGEPKDAFEMGRLYRVEQCIPHLRNRVVVDLGCRTGRLTYELAAYAKSYIGVEVNKAFYKQALITQKYIDISGEFFNCNVEKFVTDRPCFYDALFASNILYHLTPREIKLIEDVMFPRCRVVIVMSKEKKRAASRCNEMHKAENIKRWLERAGFRVYLKSKDSPIVGLIGKKSL